MDLDPIQMEDKAGFPGKIVTGFSTSKIFFEVACDEEW